MKKLILISLLSLLINSCVPLVGGFLAWKTTYPVFGEKIINGIERKKMYKKSGIYAITKEEYNIIYAEIQLKEAKQVIKKELRKERSVFNIFSKIFKNKKEE